MKYIPVPDYDNMPPPVSGESFAAYLKFREKHGGNHGKAMRALAEYFAAAMIAHAAELDRP